MTLTRKEILNLGSTILLIKEKSNNLSIQTKYKILKIQQIIQEEINITNELMEDIVDKYAQKDSFNKIIYKDGGVSINPDKAENLKKELEDLYNTNATIQELYFSLEEFEEINLDWNEIEALMPFIKI